MRITKAVVIAIVLLVFTVVNVDLVFSQDDQESEEIAIDEELEQELKWLQAETYVITPSKIPEKVKKTAASITVVTDRQIRQMGARNLDDVIWHAVPSFYSLKSFGNNSIFVRGNESSRILLMINSLPLYDNLYQSALYLNYNVLNMDNAKRIEFILGPGSALYGANAYNGVINIITKKAEDVDGVELTARGGSYDTQQYNLLFGKTFSELEIAFNFNYYKTHGNSALIKQDWFTWEDQEIFVPLGYSPVSLTPGYTDEHEDKYELAFNVKYKGFTFDGGYTDRQFNAPLRYETLALTEYDLNRAKKYYLNLGYETSLGDRLELSAKAYRFYQGYRRDNQITPPGWVDYWYEETFGTIYPEGRFYVSKNKNDRTGMEIQATYRMNDSNTIVAGVTYEEQKYYDDEVWLNFLRTSEGMIRYESLRKALGGEFSSDQKIDFKALFLEDLWDITEDLRLTLGARYDDYSTFGGEFSPRAGLTWEFIKGYDLKLLYGHAFAVPNIAELSSPVPGTTLGPQTIDSYELSLGAEFTSSFESRVTLFRFYDKDLITWAAGDVYGHSNRGELRTQGVEVEARYDFGRGTWVAGSYSYTSIKGGFDPRIYLGKIIFNIRLSRYLNLNVNGYLKSGWGYWGYEDFSGGDRDRTIVNATLIARNFLKGYEGLELRGSVYNLFDKDWAEKLWEATPYGWPQPGRNFLLEVKYDF